MRKYLQLPPQILTASAAAVPPSSPISSSSAYTSFVPVVNFNGPFWIPVPSDEISMMGEEDGSEFDGVADAEDGAVLGGDDDDDEDDDGRVLDWMIGLPSGEDLTPLSQLLVPPGLASAFSVSPEPRRTALDVERASRYTISNIRRVAPSAAASDALRSFSPFLAEKEAASESGDPAENAESSCEISALGPVPSSSTLPEAGPSTPQPDESCDDPSPRSRKRPRLAWTPQLHKRFIDVVTHLGITNAMPKTIMQMMNVEGLTRENVASHLQKYRLYLKRVQRISDEAPAPSPSEHSFASVNFPNTKSLHRHHARTSIQYPMPRVIPVPGFGMAHPSGHHQGSGSYHLFDQQNSSQSVSERMKHWYIGSNFSSVVSSFQAISD